MSVKNAILKAISKVVFERTALHGHTAVCYTGDQLSDSA
jgi:hypothetical protein